MEQDFSQESRASAWCKTYPITKDDIEARLSFDAESGNFYKLDGSIAGRVTNWGYRQVRVKNHFIAAHRLTWFYCNGAWPSMGLDHINGNKLDNRLSNLREASPSLNALNLHNPKRINKLGVLGIYVDRGKYLARINTRPKRIFIGRFDTLEEATQAYQAKKQELLEAANG